MTLRRRSSCTTPSSSPSPASPPLPPSSADFRSITNTHKDIQNFGFSPKLYGSTTMRTTPSSNTFELNMPQSGRDQITLPLVIMIFAGALGMLSFGYELTVINAPGPLVESFINETYARRGYNVRNSTTGQTIPGVTSSYTRLIYTFIVAAFAVGGLIGAPSAGPLAERFGRKRSQMFNCIMTLTAAPIIIIGGYAHVPELCMLGRFFIGISNGAATVLGPIYLAECSPRSIRGSVGVCNQAAVVLGLWLAQVLSLPVILGTRTLWPLLFVIAGAMPVVQLLLLFASAESPRWLYITRNAKAEAARGLQRLRPRGADVNVELRELEHESRELAALEKVSSRQLFKQRKYLWPLSVAIVMHFSQVLSGINGILGYSSILFRAAGMSIDDASYANLAFGAIMLTMTFVTIALIDRIGRKSLHLTGMAGCIVFGFTVALFSALPGLVNSASATNVFQICNIASIFLFLIFFAVGPASIPWMIVAELFGQEARGPATSIGCLFNWICQVITFLGFPLLQGVLGPYVYLPHVVVMILFFVYLLKYMPETNGKSFEQVAAIFERY